MDALWTILGIVVGWGLGELSSWWRDTRAKKETSKGVRTMVSLELDRNLSLLDEFWDKVGHYEGGETDKAQIKIQLARRFVAFPLPFWTRQMWESQFPLLSGALSDSEIGAVHQVHCDLESIGRIQEVMRSLGQEQNEALRGPPVSWIPSQGFDRGTPGLWAELERITESLLAKGNPLRSEGSQASGKGGS